MSLARLFTGPTDGAAAIDARDKLLIKRIG
jgi:hypothetical protein